MMELEIRNKIVQALNNVGLFFTIEELEENTIGELLPDSITYISFIVELEQAFDIEIPDEYLIPEKISSLEGIINLRVFDTLLRRK